MRPFRIRIKFVLPDSDTISVTEIEVRSLKLTKDVDIYMERNFPTAKVLSVEYTDIESARNFLS